MELPPPFPLPYDIIFNILMRFSTKSLLRLCCVSKNLNSIIKSHDFMNNYASSRPQRYLFFHSSDYYSIDSPKPKSCTIFSENSSPDLTTLQIPSAICNFSRFSSDCVLVGSCDGLLCFTDNKFFGREICVWNPSIRKHKVLPESSLFDGKFSQIVEHRDSSTVVGLGFDYKTNEFKVLRLTYVRSRDTWRKSTQKMEAEVFRLSSDSWRKVAVPDHLMKRFVLRKSNFYAYTNGGFHWLVELINEEGVHYSSILRFDVCEERFGEVEIPQDYLDGSPISYSAKKVSVLEGALSLVIYGMEEANEGGGRICIIWRKNGRLWNRQKVKFAGGRWQCGAVGDYLLLERGYRRKVFLVDPQTLEMKTVEVPRPQRCHVFSETLALL